MSNKKSIKEELEIRKIDAEEFTRVLAGETLKMLRDLGTEDSAEKVISLYLSSFVQNLVNHALSDEVIKADTKRKQYLQAKRSFTNVKSNIEFSVSSGFQNGLSDFAGEFVGYYCIIRPIPESINKIIM